MRGELLRAVRTVQQGGKDLYTQVLSFLAILNSGTMAEPTPTDPTKMGKGRAIAVLTSGGDAQGKYKGFPGLYAVMKCQGRACLL